MLTYLEPIQASIRRIDISDLFDRYVIGIEEYVKLAVKAYFLKQLNDDQLQVMFSPKPDVGAQGGFICHISNDDYFIKNHSYMGRSTEHSRVDLRELFMYRVLHLIGAGAEPHFIGSAYSDVYISKLAMHITLKRVSGFQLRANRSTCIFTAKHQTQLNALKEIFYLTDLNSANYGTDEGQRLIIVDFMLLIDPPKVCLYRPTMFDQFCENSKTCTEAIRNWNMLDKVNEADEILQNDIQQLHRIIGRDGYDEYFEAVRRNINIFQKLFTVPSTP